MGLGLEVPRWPAITAAEARSVLVRYPAAGSLAGLDWHSPRPFSAAALARTDAGEVFLKRHHRSIRSAAALAAEHRFPLYLAAAGQPLPDLLRADTGASALGLGEWTWEVHRRAAGQDLYRERQSWTPFLSLTHARAAGAALARLHRAADGYDAPPRTREPLVASMSILGAGDPLAAAAAYVAARPALASYLAGKPWRRELDRVLTAHDAGAVATALARTPSLWTHNDWHPSNLLWSGAGEVAGIIDFGLSDRTCALYDLATALERSAVRWLELAPGCADVGEHAAARALLTGYAGVRPLGRAERQLLARLLPLVHVEFALSEIDYFSGILHSTADADAAWHGYLIGHAEWFLSAPGQALLAAVASPAARHREG